MWACNICRRVTYAVCPHYSRKLSDVRKDLVVTTVDVDKARTGFFFYSSTTPGLGPLTGLATPLRRNDKDCFLLVRPAEVGNNGNKAASQGDDLYHSLGTLRPRRNIGNPAPGAVGATLDSRAGSLGPVQEITQDEIEQLHNEGGWMAPFQFETCDFCLKDVARATSAAPLFLPRECPI